MFLGTAITIAVPRFYIFFYLYDCVVLELQINVQDIWEIGYGVFLPKTSLFFRLTNKQVFAIILYILTS
jgi:hypothetical protein